MTNFGYQRNDVRRGWRNGYKPRTLKTRVGELELMVPKDREGEFQTELFERYQRSEKALVLAMLQMYVEGVSTRKVSCSCCHRIRRTDWRCRKGAAMIRHRVRAG